MQVVCLLYENVRPCRSTEVPLACLSGSSNAESCEKKKVILSGIHNATIALFVMGGPRVKLEPSLRKVVREKLRIQPSEISFA